MVNQYASAALNVLQDLYYAGVFVAVFGGVVYGIWYGFTRAKDGEVKSNTDLITNLQVQINGQESVIRGLKEDMQRLREQNIALIATNENQQKTINSYLAILANRDPAFEQFMKDVRTFMTDWHTYVAGQSSHPIINVNSQPANT